MASFINKLRSSANFKKIGEGTYGCLFITIGHLQEYNYIYSLNKHY